MRYTLLLLVLTACRGDKVPPPLREYIVTCPTMNINQPPIVDTVITDRNLWFLNTQYRIGDTYYPTTCIVKSKILAEVRN
jgi:hypothetical protein